MGLGTDIAARLDPTHTLAREQAILALVKQGQFVPITWSAVPVSHRLPSGKLLEGTVWVADNALRLGDDSDHFRPNPSHPTAQRIADELASQPKANAPDGVVLPTARVQDFAATAAVIKLEPCLQDPGPDMGDTARMLEHSRAVDAQLGGRRGLTNTEGKAWTNTNRLRGRPRLAANYGWYAPEGRYTSVDGLRLWQPGPGIAHISGVDNDRFPQGYTDYSQTLEKLVRVMMHVEGRGMMSIHDVAADPVLCWLISSEGPIKLRHPGVPAEGEGPDTVVPLRPALLTRTLRSSRPMMTGEDVGFVQRLVGVTADRVFGPKTKRAVMVWQGKHTDARGRPLTVDGIVGPRTRAAMLADAGAQPALDDCPDAFEPGVFDPRQAEYVPARYFKAVDRDVVHWLVLHSAEARELPSTAEALAAYAKSMADGRYASWHWSFDSDSAVLSVPEEHVAFHAKKANRFGVGYEHAGYARQSREQWLDDYSESMLHISARAAALITGPRWDLPLDNVVDAEGLRRAYRDYIDEGKPVPNELRGLTTHHAVSAGLGGTHVDPGDGYPMDVYQRMVKEAA